MAKITIRDKCDSEDIRYIIDRHQTIYEKDYSFDQTFGEYVESTFAQKIEHLWIAERNKNFVGCIGIVEITERIGQLRWLLVEPEAQGCGVGKALMIELLSYSKEKKYEKIFLWTVNKLAVARSMYEQFGFILSAEKPEKFLWGQNLIEQRWDLSLKENS